MVYMVTVLPAATRDKRVSGQDHGQPDLVVANVIMFKDSHKEKDDTKPKTDEEKWDEWECIIEQQIFDRAAINCLKV